MKRIFVLSIVALLLTSMIGVNGIVFHDPTIVESEVESGTEIKVFSNAKPVYNPEVVHEQKSIKIIEDTQLSLDQHDRMVDTGESSTNTASTSLSEPNQEEATGVTTSSAIPTSTMASSSEDPHILYSGALNTTTITTNDETDVSDVRYTANLTAVGSLNISEIPIDYILALDGSGSVGQSGWIKTKDWAIDFVNSLKSSDRVGIVIFATGATVYHSLNDDQTKTNIVNKLSNAQYPRGWTHTKDAVNVTIEEFDDYSTPQTPKFLFLVTDGNPQTGQNQPSQDPCSLDSELQVRDIRTLIIGVGNQWDADKLSCLVEDADNDIILIDDYASLQFNPEDLSAILRNLVNVTATNINFTLVLNPSITIADYHPAPTSIIGSTFTWLFERIKENQSIIITVDVEVTGQGIVPVVADGSNLVYKPVNSTSLTMPVPTYDVEIIVIPPIEEQFEAIRQKILSLGLNFGNTNALLVKLEHAYEDYLEGFYSDALDHLNSLINHVEALTKPKKISQTDGDTLLFMINTLMGYISQL